jgi:hypothetical protein
MLVSRIQRLAGFGAGALLVAGVTLAVSRQSLAQQERARAESRLARQAVAQAATAAQDSPDAQPQPAQPGQPGFPGSGAFPGQPGGPGGFPFPMFGGGGGALAANQTHVYVLRGGTVFALDPNTLKVTAQASLPGGPGAGGFGGGGPRFRPGGPGGQPAPGAPGGQPEPPAR